VTGNETWIRGKISSKFLGVPTEKFLLWLTMKKVPYIWKQLKSWKQKTSRWNIKKNDFLSVLPKIWIKLFQIYVHTVSEKSSKYEIVEKFTDRINFYQTERKSFFLIFHIKKKRIVLPCKIVLATMAARRPIKCPLASIMMGCKEEHRIN
jgi:hypothetical protein